jgi:hypothetical protein
VADIFLVGFQPVIIVYGAQARSQNRGVGNYSVDMETGTVKAETQCQALLVVAAGVIEQGTEGNGCVVWLRRT